MNEEAKPTHKHPELKVGRYYKWNGMVYKAKMFMPTPSYILVPVEFEGCDTDYLPAGTVICQQGTMRTAKHLGDINDATDSKR